MLQSDGKGRWSNGAVLSFDFRVEDLKTYYSEKYPQNAYRVIKDYLKENGFEHLKDSDYKSLIHDDIETTKLLLRFSEANKWFPFCLQKMDISPNVMKLDISHDLWAVRDEDWEKEHLGEEVNGTKNSQG